MTIIQDTTHPRPTMNPHSQRLPLKSAISNSFPSLGPPTIQDAGDMSSNTIMLSSCTTWMTSTLNAQKEVAADIPTSRVLSPLADLTCGKLHQNMDKKVMEWMNLVHPHIPYLHHLLIIMLVLSYCEEINKDGVVSLTKTSLEKYPDVLGITDNCYKSGSLRTFRNCRYSGIILRCQKVSLASDEVVIKATELASQRA
ncbi:hypothetical protein A0H81_10960 [Grifola frondosa]|uniref:Uncharacterized protein n=1 Tax=Grifola frondosa TaxID=5627 RepID=A0A1C7M2K0_GRIFR|nr:hypothetical protein A0H81_10960 [Grifola frondosa]